VFRPGVYSHEEALVMSERNAVDFWENKYKNFEPFEVKFDNKNCDFLKPIFQNDNNLAGKKILEIGAGNGVISIFLAKKGATVTAIDNTQNSIHNILRMADHNGVSIHAIMLDAMEIDILEDSYDYIVGRFILHHIEPFEQFVPKMYRILKNGGEGIFHENSSSNKLLMFCRTLLVGRFGIPRYGDGIEVPFQKREVEMIEKVFGSVTIIHNDMLFWRMLGRYLIRKNKAIKDFFSKLDDLFYKYLPIFNKFSYEQDIYFKKAQ
jgi:ubiquinone/menaquinone biosynthesis C-methylase UbiE